MACAWAGSFLRFVAALWKTFAAARVGGSPDVGRVDEIDPLLQVARRHAKLHLLRGVAQSHAPFADLVVDRQLPDAPRIQERHPRKVDQRRPSRSPTVAQDALEGLLASNVEFPRELDQYGLIAAPAAPCRFECRRVALYSATPVGPIA